MKKSQLIKGVLDGCVLALIEKKASYGYELMQRLKENGFETIAGGTLYPLLQKLENQGLITGEIRPGEDGPDRKYFILTAAGYAALAEFQSEWAALVCNVGQLLKKDPADR